MCVSGFYISLLRFVGVTVYIYIYYSSRRSSTFRSAYDDTADKAQSKYTHSSLKNHQATFLGSRREAGGFF